MTNTGLKIDTVKNIDYISNLLNFIEKNPKHELITPMSNYYIISCVRSVETLFNQVTVMMVDEFDMIPPDMNVTFSINDLKNIKKDGAITTGKILAFETNFQRLDVINSLYSSLFVCDFFKEIEKELEKGMGNRIAKGTKLNWEDLSNMIEERHKIIHESYDFSGGIKKLKKYHGAILLFMMGASAVIIKKGLKLGFS